MCSKNPEVGTLFAQFITKVFLIQRIFRVLRNSLFRTTDLYSKKGSNLCRERPCSISSAFTPSCGRFRRFRIAFPWNPILQRRSILIRHSNIPDLQSDFFMLFYSYWQNMMNCCIILTVNLLTRRKVSPVFYWKTEPFIPAHDTERCYSNTLSDLLRSN